MLGGDQRSYYNEVQSEVVITATLKTKGLGCEGAFVALTAFYQV